MTPKLIAGRWPAALLALALVALGSTPVVAEESSASAGLLEQPNERRVDVNLAEEAELLVLPQVGPVIARRIVDYRKAVGPFRKIEELLNVKGIGRKTLERLRPLITLGAFETESASGAEAPGTESRS